MNEGRNTRRGGRKGERGRERGEGKTRKAACERRESACEGARVRVSRVRAECVRGSAERTPLRTSVSHASRCQNHSSTSSVVGSAPARHESTEGKAKAMRPQRAGRRCPPTRAQPR
eukprot:5158533-Pleurochrysis_carterae.AAC.4